MKDRINPVTGRVEEEQPDPMEGMTEEEKEEEAKRLIVLFNKLSRSVKLQKCVSCYRRVFKNIIVVINVSFERDFILNYN